jgi:hypothetical protein
LKDDRKAALFCSFDVETACLFLERELGKEDFIEFKE